MAVEYAGSMPSEAAKIRKVLQERFAEIENPSRLEKSLLEGAAREYREDKSSHAGRYPFELLQNAHDAHNKGAARSGTAWFVWTDTALLVGDSGAGFTVKDVEAITNWRTANKERDSNSIGHKGLGFVASYDLTDTPQIFTHHGVVFGFDAIEADRLHIPPLCRPLILDESDYGEDKSLIANLRKQGAKTVIRLPFRDPGVDRERSLLEVSESLRPEILLFMPKLKQVILESGSSRTHYRIQITKGKVGSGNLVRVFENDDEQTWLLYKTSAAPSKQVRASEYWSGGDAIEAAVAVPWNEGKPRRRDLTEPLCVYYPTEQTPDLGVLIHGDFCVQSDRTRIRHGKHENPINVEVLGLLQELMNELAIAIANKGREAAAAFLDCVGDGASTSQEFDEIRAVLLKPLKECQLIPVGERGLATPGDSWFFEATYSDESVGVAALMEMLKTGNFDGRTKIMNPHLVNENGRAAAEDLGSLRQDTEDLGGRANPKGAEFAKVIASFEAFADSLRFAGARSDFLDGLGDRAVVPSEDKRWRKPDTVFSTTSKIKADLDIFDVTLVRSGLKKHQSFLEELGVRRFGVDEAAEKFAEIAPTLIEPDDIETTEKLLTAMGAYWANNPKDCRAALEEHFLYNHTEYSPIRLSKGLRVNTRSATGTSTSTSDITDGVSLGHEFTGNRKLENLYKRNNTEQFLVLSKMPQIDQQKFVDFLNYLGFSSTPRMTYREQTSPRYHYYAGVVSRDVFRTEHALDFPKCKNGKYFHWVHTLEDLELLVEDPKPGSSKAILSLWGDIGKLSDTDIYQCTAHRESYNNKKHTSRGGLTYQQWMLAENRWVPFEGDFFRPDETWKKLTGPAKDLLPKAPSALHSGPVAASDYSKPSLRAIEQGLDFLQARHSATKPGLAGVADELMTHLPRAISDSGGKSWDQWFLGHQAGERVWIRSEKSADAVILWDLPIDIPDDLEKPVLQQPVLDISLMEDRYHTLKASATFKFRPKTQDKKFNGDSLLTEEQRAQIWVEASNLTKGDNDGWGELFKNLQWRSGGSLSLQRQGRNAQYPCQLYMDLSRKVPVLWFDESLRSQRAPKGLASHLLLLFPVAIGGDLGPKIQTIISSSFEESRELLGQHLNDLEEARKELGVSAPVSEEDLVDDMDEEFDIELETVDAEDQLSEENDPQPNVQSNDDSTETTISTGNTSPSRTRTTTAQRSSGSTPRSSLSQTKRDGVRRDDGPDDRSKMGKAGEQLVRDLMADHFGATDVEDVSEQDNLGYDIRCKIDGETRFIEVKSTRSTRDAFRLTQSEKEALEEFGNQFWVVFVTNVFEDQAGPRQAEIIRGLQDHVGSFIEVRKNPDHQVARNTWELCDPEILEI